MERKGILTQTLDFKDLHIHSASLAYTFSIQREISKFLSFQPIILNSSILSLGKFANLWNDSVVAGKYSIFPDVQILQKQKSWELRIQDESLF